MYLKRCVVIFMMLQKTKSEFSTGIEPMVVIGPMGGKTLKFLFS